MVAADARAGQRPSKSPGSVRPSTSRTSSAPSVKSANHHVNPLPTDALHIDLHHTPMAAEIALAALSTLPTPILVLSSSKTVLLANAAVGRLLGVDQDGSGGNIVTDLLKDQTLSQLGIDMVSDGVPIWVSWERFLGKLASGLQDDIQDSNSQGGSLSGTQSGGTTPTATGETDRGRAPSRVQNHRSPDTVVDVAITTRQKSRTQQNGRRRQTNPQRSAHLICRMIISPWALEGQHFFTLTFTSSSHASSQKSYWGSSSSDTRNTSSHSARSSQSSHSQTPSSSNGHSHVKTSADQSKRSTFPSIAPPAQCTASSTLTDFQKVLKMKDAMLSAVEIPLIAMWRDESVVLPNLAARKLLAVEADALSNEAHDFMSRFRPWAADFSRELEADTNPVVALCRTQKAFANWQIGLVDEKTGTKFSFDVSGHPVFDERSGEFLAGLIAFKDVTQYTQKIATKTEENEEHFRQM